MRIVNYNLRRPIVGINAEALWLVSATKQAVNGTTTNVGFKKYGKGFLYNSTLCNSNAESIRSDFDFLVNERMVSTSCLVLLQAPRTIECYEDVLFHIVESFKILNADTDTAISNFITIQQTICNVNSLSVQVFLHPCVNAVNITLYSTGTDYYTTVVRDATVRGPYTLFGMVGAKN